MHNNHNRINESDNDDETSTQYENNSKIKHSNKTSQKSPRTNSRIMKRNSVRT